MVPGFQHTGTWYDYFSGNSFEVNDLNNGFYFEPGEYHIYTDYQLPTPDLNTSVEEVMSIAKSDFMLWPNPTSNELNLIFEMNQAGKIQLEVMDCVGKTVISSEITGISGINNHQIQLSNYQLNDGVYFISILSKGERKTVPFIYQN
jgi:hypothetical protein